MCLRARLTFDELNHYFAIVGTCYEIAQKGGQQKVIGKLATALRAWLPMYFKFRLHAFGHSYIMYNRQVVPILNINDQGLC